MQLESIRQVPRSVVRAGQAEGYSPQLAVCIEGYSENTSPTVVCIYSYLFVGICEKKTVVVLFSVGLVIV